MEDRFLFKAKRIDNGEWVQGSLVYDNRDEMYRIIIEIHYSTGTCITTDNAPRVDSSTICRCTGKRDKYNHLIFENDLMDGFIYPYLSGLDSEHDYFAEVCWCDDITGFGICTHKYKNSDVRGSADGDVDLIEDFDSSKWEVIGNIFDNPELLEGGE